jgi:hypothetical protein
MSTSNAPTSAVEPPNAAALARAGWSEADLAWERTQESAAARIAAGNQAAAAELWAAGLRLAREHFAANDPRLAASLTNHAVALRRSGNDDVAGWLLEEALLVWDASRAWVEAMRPAAGARSSTFHLRLERKHPGRYGRIAREAWADLAAEGRGMTIAHRDRAAHAGDGLARWRLERPATLNDLRKLMAAVLLICPDR